jgi:hypothetical protein
MASEAALAQARLRAAEARANRDLADEAHWNEQANYLEAALILRDNPWDELADNRHG